MDGLVVGRRGMEHQLKVGKLAECGRRLSQGPRDCGGREVKRRPKGKIVLNILCVSK